MNRLDQDYITLKFKFISKSDEIQNMMYHCSQLATVIRGEQWLDALI